MPGQTWWVNENGFRNTRLKGRFWRRSQLVWVLLVNFNFSSADNSINDFYGQVKVTKPENTQNEMYNSRETNGETGQQAGLLANLGFLIPGDLFGIHFWDSARPAARLFVFVCQAGLLHDLPPPTSATHIFGHSCSHFVLFYFVLAANWIWFYCIYCGGCCVFFFSRF